MIAEMSEKSDEEAKASEASVEESSSNSDSPFKTSAPPKSSFAAWKLAKGKGRKNGSKSPNRKDSSGSEAEARPKGKATGEALHNPLLAVLAAATPLPVKDVSQTASVPPKKKTSKKVTSPKKAGAAIKKESTSPKKANKKKGDASGKTNGSGKSKSKKGDNSGLKTSSFPEKIMELLLGGLAPNAIYWLPEGEAIAVDPDNFKDSTIISKHFRGNKLSSFVRSLNRWYVRVWLIVSCLYDSFVNCLCISIYPFLFCFVTGASAGSSTTHCPIRPWPSTTGFSRNRLLRL